MILKAMAPFHIICPVGMFSVFIGPYPFLF